MVGREAGTTTAATKVKAREATSSPGTPRLPP